MKEIWKDIEGYEGLYQVSNLGRVKSLKSKRFLKLSVNEKGYLRCHLSKCGGSKHWRVHRLVAQAFISNQDNKPEINHIDGDKSNNCVTNLEWVTSSENHIHSYVVGLRKRSFASVLQYDLSGNFIQEFSSIVEAAQGIGKPGLRSAVSKCCRGYRKKAGGFIWRFRKGEILKHIEVDLESNVEHPVLQYDLDGNYIREFNSVTEAAQGVGKPTVRSCITKCCLGKRKSSQGYLWKYKGAE